MNITSIVYAGITEDSDRGKDGDYERATRHG